MVCIGDTCINENHAKILNGDADFYIKTDPLGNNSIQAKGFVWHKYEHKFTPGKASSTPGKASILGKASTLVNSSLFFQWSAALTISYLFRMNTL